MPGSSNEQKLSTSLLKMKTLMAFDPLEPKHGWQFAGASARERRAHEQLLASSVPRNAARLRSCSGPCAARWLTSTPTCSALTLRNAAMQCLLRRRLGLPIFPTVQPCEAEGCPHANDLCGHHCTACTRTGRIHPHVTLKEFTNQRATG